MIDPPTDPDAAPPAPPVGNPTSPTQANDPGASVVTGGRLSDSVPERRMGDRRMGDRRVADRRMADRRVADRRIADQRMVAPRAKMSPWPMAFAILASLLCIGVGTVFGLLLSDPIEGAARALTITPPLLILVWLAFALATRIDRGESQMLNSAIGGLARENGRLDLMLTRLTTAQDHLRDASIGLADLGVKAALQIDQARSALEQENAVLHEHGQKFVRDVSSGRAEVATLIDAVGKAYDNTREIVQGLETAGLVADRAGNALGEKLAVLATQTDGAQVRTVEASQRLAKQIEFLDQASRNAAEAIALLNEGLETQRTQLAAMTQEADQALSQSGANARAAVAAQIEDMHDRMGALAALFATESESAALLLNQIATTMEGLDAGFEKFDREGVARTERLASALSTLDERAQSLNLSITGGTDASEALVRRAEALVTALGASAREIDDALPEALERLDARISASRALIGEALPEVSRLEQSAGSALDRLMESEALLAAQRSALDQLSDTTSKRIERARRSLQGFADLLDQADRSASTVADGSMRNLVEAMVRVRETGQQAAARAREALAETIPAAALKLSEAARTELSRTLEEEVQARIASLDEISQRVLAGAIAASRTVDERIATLDQTVTALEARLETVGKDADTSLRSGLPRRVAVLIEALNSVSVDIDRILSIEVSDTAWTAYLRGDRGVFTRRAVRLLDSGEVRDIQHHYETEEAFRDQVNQYIRDFEAMLRDILADRDGGPLSITLLSSDMGKLYVALAQGIERLRN